MLISRPQSITTQTHYETIISGSNLQLKGIQHMDALSLEKPSQYKSKSQYKSESKRKAIFSGRLAAVLAILTISVAPARGQTTSQGIQVTETAQGAHIVASAGVIDVEIIRENILRVDVQPAGKKSPRTLVLDPELTPSPLSDVTVHFGNETTVVQSAQMSVSIVHTSPVKIVVRDATGRFLVEQDDPFTEASSHSAILHHTSGENLYGMSGLSRLDNGGGLLRNNGSEVAAGAQGEGGAPWFFTTHYGVLLDSNGGTFFTGDQTVYFSGGSRTDAEYFVIAGRPLEVIAGLSTLTGRPPLPPKWTLGFLNSQWGSNEAEIKQIAATYRTKHIPIDAFILDYDWKAWGDDNYGEWRWNDSNFPDGASGKFAKELGAQGFKLCGILKPRVLLYQKGSTTKMTEAAAYAKAHDLFYPDEPPLAFDDPPVLDLNFGNAETRSWFWKHLEPAFDAGIVGLWNDEADHTALANGQTFLFDNFQGLNMGRMLYDGQRGYSDQRVWSINRNFYLGAQRYAYAEWSGDIETSFESMQDQRMRMLATLNLGEPHWGMDTGGFFGHPSPENYARWMEFAAFTPIFRVHGTYLEKRQPWIYGPTAEAAATQAIRLRYKLLPYIYSYERIATETGVGVVRPLFWMFPDDPRVANEGSSWMFGDALLVSPVVTQGASVHQVYLPTGTWYDYARGTRLQGGQLLNYKIDPKTWQNIPIFVRDGSIIASQPSEDYVNQHPVTEVTLDVFPATRPSHFIYYDDDGMTYAYEQGAYYRQAISAFSDKNSIQLTFNQPSGTFKPTLRSYILRVHDVTTNAVILDGVSLAKVSSSLTRDDDWSSGQDRFGPLTIIRIPANQLSNIVLR